MLTAKSARNSGTSPLLAAGIACLSHRPRNTGRRSRLANGSLSRPCTPPAIRRIACAISWRMGTSGWFSQETPCLSEVSLFVPVFICWNVCRYLMHGRMRTVLRRNRRGDAQGVERDSCDITGRHEGLRKYLSICQSPTHGQRTVLTNLAWPRVHQGKRQVLHGHLADRTNQETASFC